MLARDVMETLLQDIRFAVRMLTKSPAFTTLAVLTFAIGVGANTAIFSVVNAVLLRPPPYPNADQLIVARERTPALSPGSVSYPNYLDWQAGQRSFAGLALFRTESCNLSGAMGSSAPERVQAARVTANFLSLLGVAPRLGRDFTVTDDVPRSHKVALITDATWRRRFGASPSVLGQRLLVDGVEREIIGVLPSHIRLPRATGIYLPLDDLRLDPEILRRDNHPEFSVLGRLKPGVTLDEASSDLNAIATDLERRYPESNTGRRVAPQTLREAAAGEYRHNLHILVGAVLCVLLIACGNVANLQGARILGRGKELAVRTALGASGIRLTRQLLTESAVLALLGGSSGVVLAIGALRAIVAFSPATVAGFEEVRLDLATLTFTVGTSLGAGLLVGLWPAWQISRKRSLALVLQGGMRGSSEGLDRKRLRAGMVVSQLALAVVLLAAGALLLKSFRRAQQAPLGFDPRGILSVALPLPAARYDSDEKLAGFHAQLLARIGALPSVTATAIGNNVPFDDNEWDINFHITGTPPPQPGQEPSAEVNVVSADYFRGLKIPILRGRTFDGREVPDRARSVIIDETFAARYFPGQDPIGQHIDDDQNGKPARPPLTVVGVVSRTRNEAPGEENVEKLNLPQMYFCSTQYPQENNSLLVRVAAGDPLALVAAVKREIQILDPDQAVASISTMETNIGSSLAARRLTMGLLGAFAGLALVLASVGIYGVMALSTTQRTRELGIRLALGASRGDVLRLILGQGLSLIAIGLAAGLLGAFATSRALSSLLYEVGSLDAAALIGALVMLAAVALVACYLPARRASLVDPIEALRAE
jgi:putative ABC transport system permease protein